MAVAAFQRCLHQLTGAKAVHGNCIGEGGQRGQAGAVAAAARELRPVEIVGLYEGQKEVTEVQPIQ